MSRLFIHEAGDRASPTIVFLHGGSSSGRMWQVQFADLAGDYHCLAPDLPEHGQSSQVTPFTMQGVVSEVAELIREMTPAGKAHVVGLSIGAAIGLELIRRQPEIVERAILSGTTPRMGSVMVLLSELFYIPLLKLLPRERLATFVMKSGGIPESYRDNMLIDLQGLSPGLFRNINRAMSQVTLPEGKVPATLVLVGEKEPWISKRHAKAICSSAAGATGKTVLGVGHAWNLEAPALFNETIRAWLADQPLPSALLDLK
jgi:pimeloyl-ACP methyl ester carboxylesterase